MSKTKNQLTEHYTEEAQRLLLRAQGGDLTSLPELRSLLDQRRELWERAGDLAQHAELSMLRLVAGTNLLALEAVQRKLAELKAELAGPSPTPLERLLVDRVGVCWLQVHHLDLQAGSVADSGNTSQGFYLQRRLDSAHRRYLQAIRQLATVRKLLSRTLPSVEVNATVSIQKSPLGQKRTRQKPKNIGTELNVASHRTRQPAQHAIQEGTPCC